MNKHLKPWLEWPKGWRRCVELGACALGPALAAFLVLHFGVIAFILLIYTGIGVYAFLGILTLFGISALKRHARELEYATARLQTTRDAMKEEMHNVMLERARLEVTHQLIERSTEPGHYQIDFEITESDTPPPGWPTSPVTRH